MPSRWTSIGIVVLWLAVMGWLAGRELWQRYGPPPRLEDSLKAAARDGPTQWHILHNFERIGTAQTQVIDRGENRYQLRQHLHFEKAAHFFKLTGLPIAAFLSGAEHLKGDARIHFDITAEGSLEQLTLEILQDGGDVLARLLGTPVENELKLVLTSPHLAGFEYEMKVPYDAKNVIHSSLCPLDRMPNLWPGRRWQAPLVDPARSLMSQLIQRAPVEAVVRDEPQNYYWSAIRDWVSCLVIDAGQPDQDMHIEVWVHQEDGRVLKQKARWGALTLEIERRTVNEREQRILNGETP